MAAKNKFYDLQYDADGNFIGFADEVRMLLTGGNPDTQWMESANKKVAIQKLNEQERRETWADIAQVGLAAAGTVGGALVGNPLLGLKVGNAAGKLASKGIKKEDVPVSDMINFAQNTATDIAEADYKPGGEVPKVGPESNMVDFSFAQNTANDIAGPNYKSGDEPILKMYGGNLFHNVRLKANGGFIEFKGDSHNDPSLGIDVTKPGAQAQTFVQGGENMWTDPADGSSFVFTNDRFVPKEVYKKFMGRASNGNVTWAAMVKKMMSEVQKNPNNPTLKKGYEEIMREVKAAHQQYVPESRDPQMAGLNNQLQGASFGKYGGDLMELGKAAASVNLLFMGGQNPPTDPPTQNQQVLFSPSLLAQLQANPLSGKITELSKTSNQYSATSANDSINRVHAASRNRNPGNIKGYSSNGTMTDYAKFLQSQGFKFSKGSKATDGGYFLKFESDVDGIEAARLFWPTVKNWAAYKGLTLEEALRKYSGGGYGAERYGMDGDKLLSDYTDEELQTMQVEQFKWEERGYYDQLKKQGLIQAPDVIVTPEARQGVNKVEEDAIAAREAEVRRQRDARDKELDDLVNQEKRRKTEEETIRLEEETKRRAEENRNQSIKDIEAIRKEREAEISNEQVDPNLPGMGEADQVEEVPNEYDTGLRTEENPEGEFYGSAGEQFPGSDTLPIKTSWQQGSGQSGFVKDGKTYYYDGDKNEWIAVWQVDSGKKDEDGKPIYETKSATIGYDEGYAEWKANGFDKRPDWWTKQEIQRIKDEEAASADIAAFKKQWDQGAAATENAWKSEQEAAARKAKAEADAAAKAKRIEKAQALRRSAIGMSGAQAVSNLFTPKERLPITAFNVSNPDRVTPLDIAPIRSDVDRQVSSGLKFASENISNPALLGATAQGMIGQGSRAISDAVFKKQAFDTEEFNRFAQAEFQKNAFNAQMMNTLRNQNLADQAARRGMIQDSLTEFTQNLSAKGLEDLRYEIARESGAYDPITGEYTGANTGMIDAIVARVANQISQNQQSVRPRSKNTESKQ